MNKDLQNVDLGEDADVDFAAMLDESFKNESVKIKDGTVIEVLDDVILVNIGDKSEGRLNKLEVTDKDGNVSLKAGDKVSVVVVASSANGPIVSKKKAESLVKSKGFIETFDEDFDKVYDVVLASKSKNGVYVAIEGGIEFFIPKHQLAYRDLQNIPKNFKVCISKIDKDSHSITASRKKFVIQRKKLEKEVIERVMEAKEPINGIIKKITSYGMFVDVGGVDGLVHYKEISYKGSVNPKSMFDEGEIVPVLPISYDAEKNHLSLSIKAATENPWKDIGDILEKGDVVKVVVSNIEPYGAFVDLGNDLEGFLHISEISWNKNLKDPSEVLTIDQEIDVEVTDIDIERERLRVSLKTLQAKPFDAFIKKHRVGQVVIGKVSTIKDFGAFISLDSIDGLLHNNDFSWKMGEKCKDNLKVGDEVNVKIIDINKENEKITLSKKVLDDSPVVAFGKEQGEEGIVTASIKNIKDFGVFLKLNDSLDGLVKNQDLVSEKEDLKIGDELEVAIVRIDAHNNKIQLSEKKVERIREITELKKHVDTEQMSSLGEALKDKFK